jgi:hypothetical protein
MPGAPLVNYALAIAKHGRRVFPCAWWPGEGTKSPLTKHGFKDASRDPDQIRAWWTKHPAALIGSPVPDGQACIDTDPYHGGSWAAIEAHTGPLGATLTVLSGRGDRGAHLFFKRPAGLLSGHRLPEGVDLRDGGKHYTILPPSPHPITGKPYTLSDTTPPQALPVGLHVLLTPVPRPIFGKVEFEQPHQAALLGILRRVANALEGERNDVLFWAANRLFEKSYGEEAIDALLEAALMSGLDERCSLRTIESARRTSA